MKYKTTQKDIMHRFDVVLYTGADIARITTGAPAFAYTAGTYGHNADIHNITEFMPKDFTGTAALVDGDRPFGTHGIPYDIMEKHCKKAAAVDFYDAKFKTRMNSCLRSLLRKVYKKILTK